MNSKTEKIVDLAKQKAETRQKEILKEIDRMQKAGEKVTFYSVMKKTGAAKSYLYNNEAIRVKITQVREDQRVLSPRTEQSKDTVIKLQKAKITELEKEIRTLKGENTDSFKAKYERLLEENRSLKEQLKTAYEY